jgi:hypothetical protein
MNVSGSRLQAGGSPPDVILEVAERQIVPGETARFPFTAYTQQQAPSIHDFEVASDNPNFNPAWAHIVRFTDTSPPHYALEIHPTSIRRSQYGTYPLHLYWGRPGTPGHAEGRCTLIIKPCVRLTVKPTLVTWPTGTLSLSLENCGATGIDVSISIRHEGSNWSEGWEFELKAKEGPFEFSEKFDPPADGRRGEFELDISAEGVSLIHMQMRAKHFVISRKLLITSAVVLAGAAIGTGLAIAWGGTGLASQTITFTSKPPNSAAPGQTYRVAAQGGASGNPVTFTIDPPSTPICSITGATVTFNKPGSCVIDANQAGNGTYAAAAQVQQAITVSSVPKRTQSISFTPPTSAFVGGSANLSAKGGGSRNPVVFSVDTSSGPGVCSVSGTNGATVNYTAVGSCVIDANQAGNAKYRPARQVQGTISVGKTAQSISFTAPTSALVGGSATLSAKGGGSGNPVVFTVDPASAEVCSVSGTNGATVNYTAAGTCVIDANQAGNGTYVAAPQVQRTISVKIAQSISFTLPGPAFVFGSATLSAQGGGSGNPVVFSVAPSSKEVCTVDGVTVNYIAAGSCVINANQDGNSTYAAAPQVQGTITVNEPVP